MRSQLREMRDKETRKNRINALRKARGMTVRELIERTGFKRRTIESWLSRGAPPQVKMAIRLADALCTDMRDLVDSDER